MCQYNDNMDNTGCQSSPGTLQWNRISAAQPDPRSTQNTDAVSSINFPNPGVSCPFTLLFIQFSQISQCPYYLEFWDDMVTVTITVQ